MSDSDRRFFVLVGAYFAGMIAQGLPPTGWGTICGCCVGFLVGAAGRALLDRWSA
jgi:hypothetical protein